MKNFGQIVNNKDIITKEYDENNSVQYTQAQSLSDTQKAQARSNIGAGTSSFDGNYNSLSNKPTIPSKTSQLTNDSNFATTSQVNAKYTKPSAGIPKSDLIDSVQTSLGYADSAVRYNASQSLTADQKTQARNNIGAGTSSFSGSYNDLTNKPTIPASVSIVQVTGTSTTSVMSQKAVTDSLDTKLSKTDNTGIEVIGTKKNTTTLGGNQLYAPNGIVFGGSAAAAGLVTRGICGVTTPTAGGACTKENLYLNYDNSNDFNASRQVVVNAGTVGTHLGSNMYQYALPRGEIVKNWVESKGYATTSQIPNISNLVTLNTEQKIPGSKSFTEELGIKTVYGIRAFLTEADLDTYTSSGGGVKYGLLTASGMVASTDTTSRTAYRDGAIINRKSGVNLRLEFPEAKGTFALTSDIPDTSKMVTTDTDQSVSGQKKFTNVNGLWAVTKFSAFKNADDAENFKAGDASVQYSSQTYGAFILNTDTDNRTMIRPSGINYRTAGTTYGIEFPAKNGAFAVTSDIPTKTSQLTNDSGFVKSSAGAFTGNLTADNFNSRFAIQSVPYGTAVASNADLNTVTYLAVGNYYCSADNTVATQTNVPTSRAYMMTVYSPLGTHNIDQESTATWVYRVRKLMTYTGDEYIQYVYSGGTAGSFTYNGWQQIAHKSDIPTFSLSGTTLTITV